MSILDTLNTLLRPQAAPTPGPVAAPPGLMEFLQSRKTDAPQPPMRGATPTQEADDVNIKRFLDLIGSKEAPAGYNQLFGEREPSKPLTAMTVDQVLQLQGERAKKGVRSTAAGRYQFLQRTLVELKDRLNLSGKEKFDESLQDHLAVQLMRRRGLDAYVAGDLSREDFANNLAKEWASLPVVSGPKKGRSHYSGDGLNKALVEPAELLSALED